MNKIYEEKKPEFKYEELNVMNVNGGWSRRFIDKLISLTFEIDLTTINVRYLFS